MPGLFFFLSEGVALKDRDYCVIKKVTAEIFDFGNKIALVCFVCMVSSTLN